MDEIAITASPQERYPRIEIHNFLGHPQLSDARIKALARRDLIILSNRFIDDLEGVAKIKHYNPGAKVFIYFIASEINFGEVAPLTNDKETAAFRDKGAWWLTHVGTTLSEGIDEAQKEFGVSQPNPLDDEQGVRQVLKTSFGEVDGPIPNGSIFVQGDVFVCENELIALMGMRNGKVVAQRGYLGTAPVKHPKGTRIAAVRRPCWAREEEYYGVGLTDTLDLNMTDEAPLIDGTRPNIFKADFFADTYYSNTEWRKLFDGVFWDMSGMVDQPFRPVDISNSNRAIDSRTLHHLHMEGMCKFYRRLRERTGDFIHVGNQLSHLELWDLHRYANGSQQEGFMFSDCGVLKAINNVIIEHEIASYRAWTHGSAKPSVVWNTCQPTVSNNYRALRFSLGSTLLYNGYYQYRMHTGDNYNYRYWYDEYWVDAKGNPSDDPQHRGWLGAPLGEAVQHLTTLYTPNLLASAHWDLVTFPEHATASLHTGAELRVAVQALKIRFLDTVRLVCRVPGGLVDGKMYTLCFHTRATSPRLVKFSFTNREGTEHFAKVDFRAFIHEKSECHVISAVYAPKDSAADAYISIQLGMEEGDVFFKEFSLQEGRAETGWSREFENGAVLLNPTTDPQEFSELGADRYRKIKGKQAPDHNSGESVQDRLTVPARDAYLLVKNTHGIR